METIEYKIQSKPGQSIQVPKEYSGLAEDIVTRVVVEPNKFTRELVIPSEFPFIRNPGIFRSVIDLLNNPNSLKLQDILYLRICIYKNEQKMKSSDEKEKAQLQNLDSILVRTADTLQSTPPGSKGY